MKYYISYFYQIRNMTPNILPVSTAIWDPKWFHDNKGDRYRYIDKNGVINGIRMINLMMPLYKQQELEKNNSACTQLCTKDNHIKIENGCPFMLKYYEALKEQNSDFNRFLISCEGYLNFLNATLGLNLDTIVFIVHEAPWLQCGERPVLQKWFAENGMELKEWSKDE